MQLDRDSIARKDFPLERRGYDRAAVDAHLDAVAVAVAELMAARVEANTAGAISSKVESIVTAAEEAAKRIQREADERAREQDARVEAATRELLERIEALKTGVEQLTGGLGEAANPVPSNESGNGARDAAKAFVAPTPAEPVAEAVAAEREPEAPAAAGERRTVVEDARLVALQMLLDGSSREEVDAYLAEHFDLPDRAGLLDEVAAAAGV